MLVAIFLYYLTIGWAKKHSSEKITISPKYANIFVNNFTKFNRQLNTNLLISAVFTWHTPNWRKRKLQQRILQLYTRLYKKKTDFMSVTTARKKWASRVLWLSSSSALLATPSDEAKPFPWWPKLFAVGKAGRYFITIYVWGRLLLMLVLVTVGLPPANGRRRWRRCTFYCLCWRLANALRHKR